MKERQFQGMLNSKSVYGQSYGDYACFRLSKLNKICNLPAAYNRLQFNWFKKYRHPTLRFAPNLWNWDGEITYSQRQENMGRKRKFYLFRWRTVWIN